LLGFLGIFVVFFMVFGGYLAAGGKMGIILKALPFEMMIIGGAAVGAFLIGNSISALKHTLKDIGKVFRGPRWAPDDYRDLLCLLFALIRMARQDPIVLEKHIEEPLQSDMFGQYPRIQRDSEAVQLICDTMRSAAMNYNDPNQVEDVLDKRIDARLETALHSSHALQTMADGLPALGIVAAVLGVIKTMGSIDQPPEVLGKLIGSALVGTFLGVFLAYGFVAPFATRVKSVIEEDQYFYLLIREVLVANLHDHSAPICVEVGRQNTPAHIRPNFSDMETALKSVRQDSA
jgi:chemotaxis protein MotA